MAAVVSTPAGSGQARLCVAVSLRSTVTDVRGNGTVERPGQRHRRVDGTVESIYRAYGIS